MSEGLITRRISVRLTGSPPSEKNPLKIKLSITWRGIQPGAQFSPAKRVRKSEKISCNRNGISARAEKARNNMAAAKKQKRFQCN